MKSSKSKTLIVGLGNPILSDDGIGCRVAVALKDRLKEPEVDVLEASVAGLDFIDLLTSSGFSHLKTEQFLGGTVWIYRGQKLKE